MGAISQMSISSSSIGAALHFSVKVHLSAGLPSQPTMQAIAPSVVASLNRQWLCYSDVYNMISAHKICSGSSPPSADVGRKLTR